MSKQILTPWWKGFLTSILGTTISIALTFGTTTLVNSKKKQDAQRLTAMMLIDDIDQSIETLKKIRDHEEQGYNAAMYVLEHLDSIKSLSVDTLNIVFNYLVEGTSASSDFEFSESSERMFHSTQDTWSNLNDVRFIRNMETFYKDRHLLKELKNSQVGWVKPVNKVDAKSAVMDEGIFDFREKFCSYLKEQLGHSRCMKYLQFHVQRLSLYNNIIEGWTNMSDENKFLMNISDEEMKEFVEKTTKQNRPASEKEIIGKWVSAASDEIVTEYEYRKDHTFHSFQSQAGRWANTSGKAYFEATIDGKWHIENDSLIIVYDISTLRTNLNDSNVVYRKEMQDSLKKSLHASYEAQLPLLKKSLEENGGRRAKATSIDVTGNKLELTNPDNETTHYKRKK
ncbi:MAG: hypothetical protein IJP82_00640 [Bacteroidaceae bacterium]|nr:hypothetical protein [Bacteroidaceae bacterium]